MCSVKVSIHHTSVVLFLQCSVSGMLWISCTIHPLLIDLITCCMCTVLLCKVAAHCTQALLFAAALQRQRRAVEALDRHNCCSVINCSSCARVVFTHLLHLCHLLLPCSVSVVLWRLCMRRAQYPKTTRCLETCRGRTGTCRNLQHLRPCREAAWQAELTRLQGSAVHHVPMA
jgi:hypothetical protein